MRTMVVGGAGFIGSHLCEALLKGGDEVICVDNLSLGRKENIEHLFAADGFTFYEEDASDLNRLSLIFETAKPQYIYHLAANSDIQASEKCPEIEYRNTYMTTWCVLECMRKYGVKHMFFASTSAIYGDKRDQILDENTANLQPVSYYGAAKLGSESLISAFSYMNEMETLIFRFPNVIGPKLTHGVIYDFIKKLRNNSQELEILGDGNQTKPYIYVEDLVEAIIRLSGNNNSRMEIYNVGVEGSTSVTEIARMLCQEMKLNQVVFHYTGGEGGWKGDVPRFQYSLDKVHSAGWKAQYNSNEAVRKTIKEVLYG